MGLFNKSQKTPAEFYSECMMDFHNEAEKMGVATRGCIFIPELMAPGQQTILAFLKDEFFQMQFGSDAMTYYNFILALSIDTGICYAAKWHENYAGLSSYVSRITLEGPADDANELLAANFPAEISRNQGNDFFREIFKRWIAMHEPYWKLKDPRQYTFQAMMAGYQLGISMMLEKLGY